MYVPMPFSLQLVLLFVLEVIMRDQHICVCVCVYVYVGRAGCLLRGIATNFLPFSFSFCESAYYCFCGAIHQRRF